MLRGVWNGRRRVVGRMLLFGGAENGWGLAFAEGTFLINRDHTPSVWPREAFSIYFIKVFAPSHITFTAYQASMQSFQLYYQKKKAKRAVYFYTLDDLFKSK